jgi:L-threonylcarbamoyladenylate synthase
VDALVVKKDFTDSGGMTAAMLNGGEIVIIPTDTLYGISGAASLERAGDGKPDIRAENCRKRVSDIKGRGENPKPMIRLLARPDDIFVYAEDGGENLERLLKKWPGALTVIVRLKDEFAGEKKCAFRCPGDPWLRDVVARTGCPIFSTSANRTGSAPLLKIADIVGEFSRDVPLIVDAGDCAESLPSTIVDISDGAFKIVRQGSVVLDESFS